MSKDRPYKIGDKLIYDCPGSEDHGCRGEVVTLIGDFGFEVTWDDDTLIDYRWSSVHPGSAIRLQQKAA